MEKLLENNDWDTLTQFFPEGWEDKAKELGALNRKRKFKSASDLIRVLLIHLASDSSLMETVVKSKYGNIADVSDVAILKRLKSSSDWFRWMSNQLLNRRGINNIPPNDFNNYNIRTIDASVISEPGSTGTDWRLHYSMELFGLNCDEFIISSPKIGESFLNFKVSSKDLLIGDRAYGRYRGMKYVTEKGGDYLVRFKKDAFTIYDRERNEIDLMSKLRKLKIGKLLEIEALVGIAKSEKLPVRILAIRKSDKEAMESIRKAKNEISKKQRKVNEITLEYHRYIILVTSLPNTIKADRIMELYRLRWQIEITFKRLKSIFGLGHLPKKDEKAAKAWLHGKLFVALLSQMIIDESQFFSPWGYPM